MLSRGDTGEVVLIQKPWDKEAWSTRFQAGTIAIVTDLDLPAGEVCI